MAGVCQDSDMRALSASLDNSHLACCFLINTSLSYQSGCININNPSEQVAVPRADRDGRSLSGLRYASLISFTTHFSSCLLLPYQYKFVLPVWMYQHQQSV